MKKSSVLLPGLFFLLLTGGMVLNCRRSINEDSQKNAVDITVSKKHAVPGDTLIFNVSFNSLKYPDQVEAFLVRPAQGIEKLIINKDLKNRNEYWGKIILSNDCLDGFYGITAVCKYGHKQMVGKASFLYGKVVLDYAIMANFADSGTVTDMTDYLNRFIKIGGNAITLHANIATEKVWGGTTRVRAIWVSKVCKNAVQKSDDRIEMMLNLTDKMGIPSFISVSWDLSDSSLVNTGYMKSIRDITGELWNMFGHHPSLIGFYSYQEGSGTYFANYVRDFCQAVKQNNSGLLTMCAPNIDDPLLAGYLAAIDDLDIINYQAPIMTSYRPDNRKLFPNRRVKDVTSLSSGATRVRNKITLSHVEFMGYFENKIADAYLTNYSNIFNQFPSVASSFGPDGITFFSYFSCIYFNSKKFPAETEKAAAGVADGLKAYKLISKQIANQSSHIALYVPYNDWCIERWTNCFLPATDALCRLGISPDIIPFVPGKGEEILPYYPMNINREQLDFLLNNKYVLILPDISGMQETDSELLEAFVREGGVLIAFGPRIPYGDRFDREKLWGDKEITSIQKGKLFEQIRVTKSQGNRIKSGQMYSFAPLISTSWEPSDEGRIASYSDGTAAVFSNNYGNGKTYVITLSVDNAVNVFPDLIRDMLDTALGSYDLKRPFDLTGMDKTMDVSMNGSEKESSLSLSNYSDVVKQVKIRPLLLKGDAKYILTDLKSGNILSQKSGKEYSSVTVNIEGNNYVALRLTKAIER